MPQTVKAPTGVSIWHAVRDELVLNLYPLPYTTLPPTVFFVYLHPADYDQIEAIVPRLVSELQQALSDEVRRINHGREKSGRVSGFLTRLMAREEFPPIEVPAAGWEVHVNADRNGALQPGHLGIDSMLQLPPLAEFAGPATTRIVRAVLTETGRISTTIDGVATGAFAAAASSASPGGGSAGLSTPGTDLRERATLTYDDEQGHHVFSMRKDTLSVGRGGSAAWVDVQLITSSKVSREHFRLRRDAASGQFSIQDLSNWGTSVNGVVIPPAVKGPDGVLKPGAEHPLGAAGSGVARIDLAGALILQFEAKPLA